MQQEPIFSAVVGNKWILGFFDIYPDLSCVWKSGKKTVTGRVGTGSLHTYLKRAEEEGKRHIAGAHVQEFFWNPRGMKQA